MKPMDLSGLIKGLMVVIGIAVVLGRLDKLKKWALMEAFSRHIPSEQIHNASCKTFRWLNHIKF